MKRMPAHVDVAVVGAGPAGAHLAHRMVEAGRAVALFDPRAPWEKPCGGGITHKAWSLFPILNDPALKKNEVFTSLQITPTGRFFVIDQGHALVMVSRRDLSRVMLDRATRSGAVHVPAAVRRVETWGRRVRLHTAEGTLTADRVVGADGVRSVVRKYFLGPLPKNRTLGALCQYYERRQDDPSLIRVTPFPGYCWAFARPDALAVGVGAMAHGYSLRPELERFMRDFFPDRKPLGPPRGALLPYMLGEGAYRERRQGPGWALVGDAAGFCDTLTGEGILYAVWSADLLADAILAGRPEAYEAAWRRAFGRHLTTGAWAAVHLLSRKSLDRFFSALTACPTFRGVFMDYVWNQHPYHVLLSRLIASLPRTLLEWQAFKRAGGRITPEQLGAFAPLARHLDLRW